MTTTDDPVGPHLDLDGYPNGLLMWGQAGTFNAVDDRQAITALSDGMTGVVKPALVTAGTGLNINVAAGWLAIVPCYDGTTAVAGSRQTFTLGPEQGVEAGPSTGAARGDLLWCETDAAEARWRLIVIREHEMVGRAGLPLGRITVPAAANLASQFTYSRMVPTFGRHSVASNLVARTSAWDYLTPLFPIAPWMVRPDANFRCTAWGYGRWGGTMRDLLFRPNVPGLTTPDIRVRTGGLGWGTSSAFSWKAETMYSCQGNRGNAVAWAEATVRAGVGPGQQGTTNAVTACQMGNGGPWNPDAWNIINIQGRFDGETGGQYMHCMSCTYETIEPWDPEGGNPW